MTEPQPTLFGPADPSWPDWFRPSRYAPAQARLVALGRHPMGGELGPATSSCGTCAHLARRHYGRTYLKCELSRWTKGPTTDVRVRWRGCSRWERAA